MVRAPFRPAVFGFIAALVVTILPGSAATPAAAVSPDVVISQVYGGGGNSGATLTHDFIELYNRGSTAVDLTGWSVQYASANGSTWQVTSLGGSIAAGRHYLVRQAQGAGGTTALPTPNATGSIAMSASAGKVALVTNTTALTAVCGTNCDTAAGVRDFVGYGSANDFEGPGPAPGLTNTTAAIRVGSGATDTDNNSADFSSGPPNPRNGSDSAPAVASTVPASSATQVAVDATISVTFSEDVAVVDPLATISCTSSGTHTATQAGGPRTFTLDPASTFVEDETCTVTIAAGNVADSDTQDPPDTLAADHVFSFETVAADVCASSFTPIYSIQGSGPSAAITGTVTTQGVVVGDFEGTAAASGFYLQDATGDGSVSTSDGIFVFTGSNNLVSVGDLVRVTGYARERFTQTAINGSNSNNAPVTAAGIVLCGTGTVSPTDVELPFEALTTPERYEGMLVRLPQDLVISEYFNYERFGELVLALPLDGETRAFTPTLLEEPGPDAQARAQANLRSRITLDDAVSAQNPAVLRHPNGEPFSLENSFRGGDLVTNTVGVMGFDFSLYRIFPTGPAEYEAVNPRTSAPEDVGGRLRVAAMNTLNFFLTLDPLDDSNPDNPADNICGPTGAEHDCRGADLSQPLEFDRQRTKLIAALAGLDSDVIGLNEIENTLGVDPLGDPDDGVVAGLNERFGPGTYDSIDTGVVGTDAIRVGLIYRPGAVTPVGDYAVLDSSVDPRFNTAFNRPALAQTFEENATGARFTVVVNHLKSKGSNCNAVGDPDTGDGSGNCNLTRLAAAQALVDWIQTDPTGSGDRDFLIIGDLNSYAREDPIDAILAGADDEAATADDWTNLIEAFGGPYAYSYVFDGQAGYLDHALSSATMTSQVTGATEWHINADEPDLLDYDTSFKPPAQELIYEANAYRSSDHDPVVVGLDLLAFGYEGFVGPVANPPTVNVARAGSTIPILFTLAELTHLDVLFTEPTATRTDCSTGAPLGDPVALATNVGLAYDAETGVYRYEWKTSKSLAGTCQEVELLLDDGTFRLASFRFR